VKPKKQKTPVGVGADGGSEELAEGSERPEDQPEIGEPGEQ